jgi:hypothetical protein
VLTDDFALTISPQDLVSYEVTKTEPFTVKEIVEGEGEFLETADLS